MERRDRKWALRPCLMLLVLLVCLAFSGRVQAAGGEKQTLRVGFPIQAGLTELDENGNYSGYSYEYLEEIAQYTGWNYEFVTLDGEINSVLTQMLEMLQAGELDLMGGIVYNDALAQSYDYPGYSCGTAYSVLAVLDQNAVINSGNFQSIKPLRIALMEKAKTRNAALAQFCTMNQMTVEYLYCKNEAEQLALVRSGQADAMVSVELSLAEDLKTIAKFAPQFFYFVTTKGNGEVTAKLNGAILDINEADPFFTTRLYEKYFSASKAAPTLSLEEQSYLRGADPLRVAIVRGRAPIQDVGEDYTGISRDVLDYIAAETGLQFQYVPVDSLTELEALLASGNVDLAAGIPYDYNLAQTYHVALTRPYLSSQVVMVLGQGVDHNNLQDKRLALTDQAIYGGPGKEQALWYATVADCLDAVARGEADYTYGNGYIVQYYMALRRDKLDVISQSGVVGGVCIGVAKPAEATLLTLLNKMIRGIPSQDIQAMIYSNATPQRQLGVADFLRENAWLLVLATAIAALIIIGSMLAHFRVRMRLTRQMEAENERYRLLSELSNEYLFEYDFQTDCITLSPRSAQVLGVEAVEEHFLETLAQDTSPQRLQQQKFIRRLLQEKSGTEDFLCSLKDGTARWLRITVKLVNDGAGRPLYSIGKIADVQEAVAEREQLIKKAQQDSLTGLYNAATVRQLVMKRLPHETPGCGALLVLDIDFFKQVNDHFGHFTGDQVLGAVAQLLTNTFRSGDVIGRIGGDEFMVYLPGVSSRDVVEQKCKALLAGAAALTTPVRPFPVTLSIGGVMLRDRTDFETQYRNADEALYDVKKSGRNGYKIE